MAEKILEYYSDQKEEPKTRRSKKKRQKKNKGRPSIVEEGKEEGDIPHPITREEIDIILPQDIMQHETIEQESPLNTLSEGEK